MKRQKIIVGIKYFLMLLIIAFLILTYNTRIGEEYDVCKYWKQNKNYEEILNYTDKDLIEERKLYGQNKEDYLRDINRTYRYAKYYNGHCKEYNASEDKKINSIYQKELKLLEVYH